MKTKLKNVLANPFRDMANYPINGQKIAALKKSIEDTEFWENVVARDVGNGKIEIAYGHHRLHTLREMYGENSKKEFSFIVKPLDDEAMLKIMAHENLEEWGHVSDIERETVRAVVKAFGEDRIALNKPSRDTSANKLRFAPSFCFGRLADSADRPYTATTIATFLGWEEKTVSYTLRALCLIEQGYLTEDELKGLSHNQARLVVDETNRAVKRAEQIKKNAELEAMTATPKRAKAIERQAKERATAVVKTTSSAASKALKRGGSAADAKTAALDARARMSGTEKELPEINEAAGRLASRLHRLMDPDYDPGTKLEELIKHKKHLSSQSLHSLDRGLERIAEYVEGYRHRLNGGRK